MSAADVLGGKGLVSQEENGQVFLWSVASGNGRYLAALNKNSLVTLLRLEAFPDYSREQRP
jgi:hypothetical protein